MSTSLQVLSPQVNSILGVRAREALNASGTPALEVTVETIQGTFSAMTTIGPYDNDTQRFGGKGLLKSVDSVEKLISEKLVGKELNQPSIDALIQEEPTPPANVVLAVSMACCRAAAKHSDLELHEYIAQLGNVSDPCIPVPVFSVINGADAASSPLHLKVTREGTAIPSPHHHLNHLRHHHLNTTLTTTLTTTATTAAATAATTTTAPVAATLYASSR